MTVIRQSRISSTKNFSMSKHSVGESPEQGDSAALSGDVSIFGRYLTETGQTFVLLSAPGGQAAQVRFTGSFEGKRVVWDCQFVTLAYRAAQSSDNIEPESMPTECCFIDIGQPGSRGVPLRVGLKLPCIDIPAIRKMIILIRNYKYLRRGRHEFTA